MLVDLYRRWLSPSRQAILALVYDDVTSISLCNDSTGQASPKKRQAVNMMGAERWGTVNHQCIHGNINATQLNHLNAAYRHCMKVLNPGTSTDLVTRHMAQVFNHWHSQLVPEERGGLGGHITKKAVITHLSQMGDQVTGQQL